MSDPNMVAGPKALGFGMVATPKHRSDIIARLRRGCDFFWVRPDMSQTGKIKKN